MKKILIISAIVLVVIVGLFENIGEDIPEEEVNAKDTKIEETIDKSRNESTDEDKEEAKRENEEKKEKEEQAAKEKEKEEQAAKEEQEAKQKEEEEKEAQAKAEEEEENQRKENEAKEKAEQEAEDKEDAEALYLQIMNENVGSYVDIQFDKTDKIYTLTPIDQGLIDEISMLPMGIGHENWGVLVDGMVSMSKSGKDLVGEGYSMNLVNPLNHENVILWIVDGEVIYNVIDDL